MGDFDYLRYRGTDYHRLCDVYRKEQYFYGYHRIIVLPVSRFLHLY